MKILVPVALCTAMLTPVPATPEPSRSAAELVEAAQQAMVAERYHDASDLYEKAGSLLPEAAEIPYNMGVAAYRQGDLARAVELFDQARLLARDPSMQARTAYNLGTASAGQAMQSQALDPAVAESRLQGATETLRSAMKHFREAIAADPLDQDARANGELAWTWLQQLEELQEQMQQQGQENQEQDQDPNEDQNQDQQQQGDQQQQQDQQQQGEQQQQDRQQQTGQQEQEQPAPSEAGNDQQQDRPDERQASAERTPMSREEAERLLQSVRDKEARRREELARIQAAGSPPVDKDW
ncbi:MAG: hypothetical protein IID28_06045 [Planctomycetes bacterium]|nr:hypothetical protein [Planctomycetota bacterium]